MERFGRASGVPFASAVETLVVVAHQAMTCTWRKRAADCQVVASPGMAGDGALRGCLMVCTRSPAVPGLPLPGLTSR